MKQHLDIFCHSKGTCADYISSEYRSRSPKHNFKLLINFKLIIKKKQTRVDCVFGLGRKIYFFILSALWNIVSANLYSFKLNAALPNK